MDDRLEALTAAALGAARRAGADAADTIAVDARSLSVDVRNGRLEKAERSEATEIGLRVLVGRRQACVSVSDVSDRSLAAMAERAVAMAREAPEDVSLGLADPGQLAALRNADELDLCDPSDSPVPAALEQAARAAEEAALAVPGVSRMDVASAGWGLQRVHLAATNGFSGGYARSSHGVSAVAITGSGTAMERDWASESRLHAADLPSPETVGRLAGERAAARAGSRKPPTGRVPVLYDERIAAGLIGHLLAAINGTAIVRGASWLRDALGESVLPSGIDLAEEPLRPRAGASRPFDAEGLPTGRRLLVEDGRLTGWVLDLGTARRLGLASTGNAGRGTSAPPSPGVSNIALTQGRASPADLMRDMGTGLLVTSMLGASINPTTGDYSRGAAGFWIENGEPTYPVNECTLAGNLRDMLRTIIPANDARAHRSHVVPSLLVEGLTLAGA
jgi:PmbA protein